jgi:hypothetical protein
MQIDVPPVKENGILKCEIRKHDQEGASDSDQDGKTKNLAVYPALTVERPSGGILWRGIRR